MSIGKRRPGGQPAVAEVRRADRALRLVRLEAGELIPHLARLRLDARAIVEAGLASAGSARLVAAALDDPAVTAWLDGRPLHLVAAGKSAPFMARALTTAWPTPLSSALAVGTHGPIDLPAGVAWIRASHPTPDHGSVRAGDEALRIAARCRAGDRLIVLLSGGASSLLAAPASPVSLEDKRQTTARLLRAGADITVLNTVRKHLSRIKGGWLAATAPCPVLTLALSDVIGDDPSVIASGPTTADPSRFVDALMGLDRFGGRQAYPATVVERLEAGAAGRVPETPKPGDPRLDGSMLRIIGSRVTAIDGARRRAEALGYRVAVIDEPVAGEARLAAVRLIERVSALVAVMGRPACVLAAGETTVTVRGNGRGGRNQELALAAVEGLGRFGAPAVVASAGTDGIDGPTEAAGALCDTTTLDRARQAGCPSVAVVLDENDSHTWLARLGDTIVTGPTDTNVGDLQVVIVGAR